MSLKMHKKVHALWRGCFGWFSFFAMGCFLFLSFKNQVVDVFDLAFLRQNSMRNLHGISPSFG